MSEQPQDAPVIPALTSEQKLTIRTLQVQLLQAQSAAQQANQKYQQLQMQFRNTIETYAQEQKVDVQKFSFDLETLEFKTLPVQDQAAQAPAAQ